MIGWVGIVLGVLIFINVVWGLILVRPGTLWGWTWQVIWLAAAGALVYYGYRQEYPPAPTLLTGGRSSWY